MFPARRVAGGGGKVGEKDEGLEPHLWVVLARREVAGGGGATADCGGGNEGVAQQWGLRSYL